MYKRILIFGLIMLLLSNVALAYSDIPADYPQYDDFSNKSIGAAVGDLMNPNTITWSEGGGQGEICDYNNRNTLCGTISPANKLAYDTEVSLGTVFTYEINISRLDEVENVEFYLGNQSTEYENGIGFKILDTASVGSNEFRYYGATTASMFLWSQDVYYNVQIEVNTISQTANFTVNGASEATNIGLKGSITNYDSADILPDANTRISWVKSWLGTIADKPSGAPPVPIVTLLTPVSGNITARDVNLTWELSGASADSCELWTNMSGSWALNSGISAAGTGTYDWGKIGLGSTVGRYIWGVRCELTGVSYWSSNNTLIVDTLLPTITLDTTHSDFSTGTTYTTTAHANPYNDSVRVYVTLADNRDLYAFFLNITSVKDGSNVYSNGSQSLSGTSYDLDRRINTSSWADGIYKVTVNVSDSHTAMLIPSYANYARNKQLEYLTAEGNHIWIESDDDATTKTTRLSDRYDMEFEFKDGLTKERTFHVKSDSKIEYRPYSNYKAHFIISNNGITGNWLDFEGIPGTPTILKISDYHYLVVFESVGPKVKINSLGGLNTNSAVYYFYEGKYNLIAPPALEGATTTLQINITGNSQFIFTNFLGNLTYNGTVYGVTDNSIDTLADNYFYEQLKVTFIAPSTASIYYYNWYFTPKANVVDPLPVNTSQGSHEVTTWLLDDCSTQPSPVLRFMNFDEDNPTVQNNVTYEVDIQYWISTSDTIKNYSTKLENSKNFTLCMSLAEAYSNIYIKYTNPAGYTHRYFAYNTSLSNSSLDEIKIYNFNSTSGVSNLQLTTRYTETYDFYPNVLGKLMRFYPDENVYRAVQMYLSGGFGLMVFNIKEVTTDYKIIFTDQNNNLLRTLDTTTYKCASSVCELNVLLSPFSATVVLSETGVSYYYNNDTGLIEIVWNEPSGLSIDITYSVDWIRSNGFTNICSESATAASGTFTCNVSGYYGSVYLTLNSTKSGTSYYDFGEIIKLISQRLYSVTSQADASFWAFLILLPVAMAGLASPVIGVLSALVGLVFIYYLGLLSFISISVLVFYTIGGVIIGLLVRT